MAFPVLQSEVLVVTQFGLETTPGVLVPATKLFNTLKFAPKPNKPTTAARESGNKFTTGMVPGKGMTTSAVTGDASVQDITYLSAMTMGTPSWGSFAASGASLTGAIFVPKSRGVGTITGPIITATLEQGVDGAGNANSYGYGFGTGMSLSFTPDKQVSAGGSVTGRQRQMGQTLTASPARLGASLLFPTLIDVYLATSEAGLDAAESCHPFKVDFKYEKAQQPVPTLNTETNSFDSTVEDSPDCEVDITLPYSSLTDSLEQAIDNSTLYYIRIYARGTYISGGSGPQNALLIDMPVNVTAPDEGATNGARHAAFKLVAQDDANFNAGTGGALRMVLQSALTAL